MQRDVVAELRRDARPTGDVLREYLERGRHVMQATPEGRAFQGALRLIGDPEQRYLVVSSLTNNKIWLLNREDGSIASEWGHMGENGGQFFGLHMIAVDSGGNIYTGEVFAGERVQRFVPDDSPRGQLLQQLAAIE